jgi:HemY protein
MRWLISLILIAAVAVALALAGRFDPGYVVLVYPPWRAELSFITFLMLLVLLMTGGYLLARLAIATLNLPQSIRERKAQREAARQNQAFTEAIAAYFEGRYQEAEKLASRLNSEPRREMLARVLAARAAHAMRAYTRRDVYLAEARSGETPLAALYAEAENRLENRDFPGALTAIEAGKVVSPAHTALARLELKVRSQLGQWDEVLKLTEQLAKANAIDAPTLELTRHAAHCENLKRRADSEKSLLDYWKKLPGEEKTVIRVALEAANAFALAGNANTAVSILENALDKHWDDTLAARYGQIISQDPLKQIERAEKWLVEHPRDGALLMSLADLCAHERLWGKAQSYAEASLAVAPNIDAHLALAALKEQTGQSSEACGHLKQALALCQGGN